MLSIKSQNWTTGQIKAELKDLEAELLKATRELIYLENRYRSKKMEALARIEALESENATLKRQLQEKTDKNAYQFNFAE